MRLPLGDEAVELCGSGRGEQLLTKRLLAEHLRELGQELQIPAELARSMLGTLSQAAPVVFTTS